MGRGEVSLLGSTLKGKNLLLKEQIIFINPFALRTAKTLVLAVWSAKGIMKIIYITLWSFCHSEGKRVKSRHLLEGFPYPRK